jgi:U3 small nucleolar RNA-associated protein 13
LNYIKDWNTVSRSSDVAQSILHAILKYNDADAVLSALEGKQQSTEDDGEVLDLDGMLDGEVSKPKKQADSKNNAGEVLGALIPYTERHMTRADKLVRESFIVEHLLGMMEGFDEFDAGADQDGMEVDR